MTVPKKVETLHIRKSDLKRKLARVQLELYDIEEAFRANQRSKEQTGITRTASNGSLREKRKRRRAQQDKLLQQILEIEIEIEARLQTTPAVWY